MANVMALVSKGVFEAQHRGAKVGDVLPMDRYVSANKGLVPLEEGGSLFLVTVRPPDEALWLVAILESPKFDGKQWTSKKNVEATRDLANVQKSLKFSTGSGLSTKAGALGMSLQTPRTLTDEDVALLRGGAAKSAPAKEPRKETKKEPPKPVEPIILAEPPKDDALGPAEAALNAGDRQAALDALLTAWRACRAPELAELIDIVSDDVNRSLPALDVDAKDYVQQWMEVEVLARSIDVPRLIPGLQAEPIGTLGDRVHNLIARGPDPRVGRALVKFVDAIPTTASSRFNVWVRIFDALPTMVDASSAADFKRFAKKKDEGGGFYEKYFKWLAKLELPEVAKLDAGDKKRVEAMTKQAKALAKGPAPLLEKTAVAAKESPEVTVSSLDPAPAIQAALEAMRAAKWEPAMQYLQMAWAKTRDEELAELIEKFALALQPHLERAPKDHRAWLAREAKHASVDVQPLLDARGPADSELVQKLGRLLARPDDSRIAAFLADAIDNGYGKTSADYWTVILDLAVKHATPKLGALLEQNARDIRPEAASHFPYWRPRQRQIVRVHDAFRERLTRIEKLPDAARSLFAELSSHFPKAPAHPEAAMIADILASTSDDPRLVFADWLMEKGDPLGEWISVQVGLAKNPTDKKLLARQKALTKTNKDRDALLGPLTKVIDNRAAFKRGMLARVAAQGDVMSDRILHAHPRLSTVEDLNVWMVEHETALAFVQSPAMVSLRRIRELKYDTMLALAGSQRPLPIERVATDVQREDQPEEERAILADAPGLPALRVLGIDFELDGVVPEWILGGALGKRLQKIACREQSVAKWKAAVKKSGLPIEVIVEDPMNLREP